MEKSAGLVLTYNNMILLVHPTGALWKGTYSIPKGHVEKGEKYIDAAIREVKEEVGIKIDKDMIDESKINRIDYRNKKGKRYKVVYWWHVNLDNVFPQVIRHFFPTIPRKFLQLEEVDWAGFLELNVAKEKIFWRFKDMLEFIK